MKGYVLLFTTVSIAMLWIGIRLRLEDGDWDNESIILIPVGILFLIAAITTFIRL